MYLLDAVQTMYHLSVYKIDQYCTVKKNIDFPSLQTSVRNVIKIQCVKLSDKIDIACDYGIISSQLVRNGIKIQCVKRSDKTDIAYDYGIISSQLVRNVIKIQCVKLSDKIDIAYDYKLYPLSCLYCLASGNLSIADF